MDLQQQYDYLIDCGICNEKTLMCITGINGFNQETINDVIYYFTGYRNIEQLKGDIEK